MQSLANKICLVSYPDFPTLEHSHHAPECQSHRDPNSHDRETEPVYENEIFVGERLGGGILNRETTHGLHYPACQAVCYRDSGEEERKSHRS